MSQKCQHCYDAIATRKCIKCDAYYLCSLCIKYHGHESKPITSNSFKNLRRILNTNN